MPELIEAYLIAQDLKQLIGQQLLSFTHDELLKNAHLLTCPIQLLNVKTHGKKIILEFGDILMIVSLGMTGKFTCTQSIHCHITLNFDNLTIYYDDARKFGKIDVVSKNNLPKYYTSLGINLINHLDNWITKETWFTIFKPKLKNRKICDILVDQTIIAGVGSYICTDVLYLACVHPLRLGKTITDDELEMIRVATHEIINLSFRLQGHSFSDFERLKGEKGGYEPLIYGRETDMNGFKVIDYKINPNRSVHYVREVQI